MHLVGGNSNGVIPNSDLKSTCKIRLLKLKSKTIESNSLRYPNRMLYLCFYSNNERFMLCVLIHVYQRTTFHFLEISTYISASINFFSLSTLNAIYIVIQHIAYRWKTHCSFLNVYEKLFLLQYLGTGICSFGTVLPR
jgi:hypothetical protein